jgi:hypothetical protein
VALTPWAFPLALAPWILEEHKPFAFHFNSSHDGVGVKLDDTFALSPATAPHAGGTAEEKLLIDFEELFFPEVLLV